MSTSELDQLIKMVNQIADNIGAGDSDTVAAARVVDHLNRFWPRSMKEKIIEYATCDGSRLNAIAVIATSQL